MIKLMIKTCASPAKVILSGQINDQISWDQKKLGSEVVVEKIDQLLKRHNLAFRDLTQIRAESFCDQGSYTGLRIGVAAANALNLALGRVKNDQDLIRPDYGQAPKVVLK